MRSWEKRWVREEEELDHELWVRWGSPQGMLQDSAEWEGDCEVAEHQVIAHPGPPAQGVSPWLFVHGDGEVLVMVEDPVSPPFVTLWLEGW